MAQDTTPAIVIYQGNGSQTTFSVPFDKGYYGDVKVAFVRRGLTDYTYNPDTYTVSGRLYAWVNGATYLYTHTAIPAVNATVYDANDNLLTTYDEEDPTIPVSYYVQSAAGSTVTINNTVYTRAAQHDIENNMLLTWTGDMLEVGDYICIVRETERGQPYEMPNNQKHIEGALDNIERQVQEVKDGLDSALKIDPSYSVDTNKMNPLEWMDTIVRSTDKSIRGLKYDSGWLLYSLDDPNKAEADKTWTRLLNTDNIKKLYEVVTTDPDTNEEVRKLYYVDQNGNSHIIPLSTALNDITDVEITNATAGQFLRYDGIKWKNISSTAYTVWGDIAGDISNQTDLKNALDAKANVATTYTKTEVDNALSAKVNIDGTSIMTAPLKFASGSMRGAVGPYLNGVSFWKMDAQYTITNIANLTDSRFLPVTTNSIDLGRSANTWKDLYLGGKAYVATINNGADLAVPIKSGTLATMGDVELAARSGRMLTDQGVWYAKMYSATVAPSAEDGTNYADFSQVDQDNNPIIVIYTRTSGAWVQSETITPPADYDGYVPITSKIWDIAEQSGQQGGRVLWNHTSKEFTPYPVIISFEDVEITGNSTVIMPLGPSSNQIVNKDYVDSIIPTVGNGTITLTQGGTTKGTFTVNQSGDTTIDLDAGGSGGYHPDLFDFKWADHTLNDVQWLRADTFSWQSGSVYEAAFWDLFYDIQISTNWYREGAPGYTAKRYPEVGDPVYLNSDLTTPYTTVEAYDSVNDTITAGGNVYTQNGNTYVTPTTETVAGYTVSVYTGHSGKKITIPTYETAVSNIYTATGVAWYYILDIPNKRFKLPRTKFGFNGLRDTVGKYIEAGLPNITGEIIGSSSRGIASSANGCFYIDTKQGTVSTNTPNERGNVYMDASRSSSIYGNSTTVQEPATQMYLYFYVGNFTQTALENTAGLNAELFNDKADLNLANALANIDFVVESQLPTAGNNYTWYRKYRSGWVEQGSNSGTTTNTLPIEMSDSSYTVLFANRSGNYEQLRLTGRTTTQFTAKNANSSGTVTFCWEVKGVAA